MKKNLFINLSKKDLENCYRSWMKVQIKREQSTENEVFSSYIDEYIWMLERDGEKYKYYDDQKKYNIGFALAEKDMLCVMARRYLKLCDTINELKHLCAEDAEMFEGYCI